MNDNECYLLTKDNVRKDLGQVFLNLGEQNIRLNSFPELHFFDQGYTVGSLTRNDFGQIYFLVSYPDNSKEWRYYNEKTHLLENVIFKYAITDQIWFSGIATTFMNKKYKHNQSTFSFSDYKEIDGVLVPFSLSVELMLTNGEKFVAGIVDYENIYINQNVTEADFRQ